MDTAADLTTRGGRVKHIRYSLATRYGNVSLERFGEIVAAEESRLTGETVTAYAASTVLRWEAGGPLFLNAALALASLGKTTPDWIAVGDPPADQGGDEGGSVVVDPPKPVASGPTEPRQIPIISSKYIPTRKERREAEERAEAKPRPKRRTRDAVRRTG